MGLRQGGQSDLAENGLWALKGCADPFYPILLPFPFLWPWGQAQKVSARVPSPLAEEVNLAPAHVKGLAQGHTWSQWQR